MAVPWRDGLCPVPSRGQIRNATEGVPPAIYLCQRSGNSRETPRSIYEATCNVFILVVLDLDLDGTIGPKIPEW